MLSGIGPHSLFLHYWATDLYGSVSSDGFENAYNSRMDESLRKSKCCCILSSVQYNCPCMIYRWL